MTTLTKLMKDGSEIVLLHAERHDTMPIHRFLDLDVENTVSIRITNDKGEILQQWKSP